LDKIILQKLLMFSHENKINEPFFHIKTTFLRTFLTSFIVKKADQKTRRGHDVK
jgi:hypothetical protein